MVTRFQQEVESLREDLPALNPQSVIVRQLRALARKGKKFDLITADPPWNYKDKAQSGNRGAQAKYKGGTTKIEDLMALWPLIEAVAKPNCTILMWGTWPLEGECRRLIKCWGFQKRTCAFVWIKLTKDKNPAMGMGNYTRSNSEYVLLATRGKNLPRKSKSVGQIIMSERRENSRKPDEYFDKVDQLYGTHLDRLELYGRSKRKGWIVLGDETDKF